MYKWQWSCFFCIPCFYPSQNEVFKTFCACNYVIRFLATTQIFDPWFILSYTLDPRNSKQQTCHQVLYLFSLFLSLAHSLCKEEFCQTRIMSIIKNYMLSMFIMCLDYSWWMLTTLYYRDKQFFYTFIQLNRWMSHSIKVWLHKIGAVCII